MAACAASGFRAVGDGIAFVELAVMEHFQALTDHDLETITGGADDQAQGGGNWFSKLGQGVSNQWQGVKDGWSNAKDNLLGGIKQMMGPAGRYSGL